MTSLNTIIEEEKRAFEAKFGQYWSKHLGGNVIYGGDITQPPTTWVNVDTDSVKAHIASAMQRAYEAGRDEGSGTMTAKASLVDY